MPTQFSYLIFVGLMTYFAGMNQWYLYNDRHEPQRRSLDEILRESAYMLFCERPGVALQPALVAYEYTTNHDRDGDQHFFNLIYICLRS